MPDLICRLADRARALFGPRARYWACAVASTPRLPAPAPEAVPVRSSRMFDAPVFHAPVFDDELDMVRPYVLLHEQSRERRRQAERRRALRLALDGIDVGPRRIHGVEVAR